MLTLLLILCAGIWAGTQNALAGGGSFVTLPTLIVAGLDPRAANITSTIALFPGQATTGWLGRREASAAGGLAFRALVAISLAGGICGAALLLLTPASFFARLVPWLVLFATTVFAWGSFFRKPQADAAPRLSRTGAGIVQFFIAVYGGYFGGGIGFLMMAAMSLAGLPAKTAAANKNILAAVLNASAVAIFCFFPQVRWLDAAVLAVGAIIGGVIGSFALKRVNERALRIAVVVIGAALTVGLFLRPA